MNYEEEKMAPFFVLLAAQHLKMFALLRERFETKPLNVVSKIRFSSGDNLNCQKSDLLLPPPPLFSQFNAPCKLFDIEIGSRVLVLNFEWTNFFELM